MLRRIGLPLLLLSLLLASGLRAANESIALVVKASGEAVRVISGNAEEALTTGMRLNDGDKLRTGTVGRAVLIFTDQPPAESRRAYAEVLMANRCLSPVAVGDPLANPVVPAPQHPLGPEEIGDVEGEAGDDDEGQPHLVDGHDDERHQDLGPVDEEHHPAPLHELLHRPDVGRDPRHQRAATLGLHVEDRPSEEVAERQDP